MIRVKHNAGKLQHNAWHYWYLYSGLCEFCPLGQLLSGVDIWVMCPFKSLLQLLQLLSGEGGATASLLPLQGQVGLWIYIWTFVCAVTWVEKEKDRERSVIIMQWIQVMVGFVWSNWEVFVENSVNNLSCNWSRKDSHSIIYILEPLLLLQRARLATLRIQVTATPLWIYNWENIILICGYLFNIEEALIHNPASVRGPRGGEGRGLWGSGGCRWVEGLICTGHLAAPHPAFLSHWPRAHCSYTAQPKCIK